MESADMQDLGSCAERRMGSSPFIRTSTVGLTVFETVGSAVFFIRLVSGRYVTVTPFRVCTDISGISSAGGISIDCAHAGRTTRPRYDALTAF